MIKAISFDIGDTLIKSTGDSSLSQQLSMISPENTKVFKQAYMEHFLTRRISLEDFCKKTKISQEEVIEKVNQYYRLRCLTEIWEDVTNILTQLKQADIVLISLSNKSYMNPFCLKSYGLHSWFSKEIYSCDIGYAKPQISIFQYAQHWLQMKPYEILHVGDSYISDYLGSQNACWNSVLLNRHHVYDSIKNTNISIITNLNELLEYVL